MLLFPASESSLLPERLRYLEILPCVRLHITRDDGRVEDAHSMTVFRCSSDDQGLHEYFLDVAETVIARLPRPPSAEALASAIDHLRTLFIPLARRSPTTIQGLWAELFLIAGSSDPLTMLRAWHQDAEERFDFALDAHRVEVKSTIGREHVHRFSLAQLDPVPETNIVVAVLLMERSTAGVTVRELAEYAIATASSADQRLAEDVERTISQTLGDNWREAGAERYDVGLATASLRFFDQTAVPRVGAVPHDVLNVRFDVRLDHITSLPRADLVAQGGLFGAAASRDARVAELANS